MMVCGCGWWRSWSSRRSSSATRPLPGTGSMNGPGFGNCAKSEKPNFRSRSRSRRSRDRRRERADATLVGLRANSKSETIFHGEMLYVIISVHIIFPGPSGASGWRLSDVAICA